MEIQLREKPRGFSIYKRAKFQLDMSKGVSINKYLFNIGLCAFNNKEEPEIINTHIICTREQANDYLNCLTDKCIDDLGYKRHQIFDSWIKSLTKVDDYDIILQKEFQPIIIDHRQSNV